jgi:hypothetical protein
MPTPYAILTLLRLLAFMVLVYLGLGWLVARRSDPDGTLRAFFRVVCSPVTRLVARCLPPGAPEERVLRMSFLAVSVAWMGLVGLHLLFRPAG